MLLEIPMAFNEDQLLEIFSWLPGKDLDKFPLVSKSINKLLSDDFFIKKQSENMRSMGDSDFLLQHNGFWGYGYDGLELHTIQSKGNQSRSLPCKIVEYLGKFGKVLASINGLLLCRKDGENSLFLFNPTTRSCMQVPIPDERSRFNIIFDRTDNENGDDYLLLSIVAPHEWSAEFQCKIFSPSEKIWKDLGRMDLGGRNIMLEYSVHSKGVLYFVSDGGLYFGEGSQFFWPYIVAYDMKNHTSEFLQIPKKARKGSCHSNLAIFKWGSPNGDANTICLVRLWRNMFSVWVLCPITDTSSSYWKMVFHRRIKEMGLRDIDQKVVTGYSVLNGMTLLFATEEKVYGYDLSDGTEGKIKELCEHGFGGAIVCFHPFCSTLRRCGRDTPKKS